MISKLLFKFLFAKELFLTNLQTISLKRFLGTPEIILQKCIKSPNYGRLWKELYWLSYRGTCITHFILLVKLHIMFKAKNVWNSLCEKDVFCVMLIIFLKFLLVCGRICWFVISPLHTCRMTIKFQIKNFHFSQLIDLLIHREVSLRMHTLYLYSSLRMCENVQILFLCHAACKWFRWWPCSHVIQITNAQKTKYWLPCVKLLMWGRVN